jgi:competence protein ComEC
VIEILILDVGHGNSTIVSDGEKVLVVDTPSDDTLIRTLRARGWGTVDYLLISHADNDHLGGAVPLLAASDIEVRHVYLNPDPARRTHAWDRVLVAIEDAQRRAGTAPHAELTDRTGSAIALTGCTVDVLFPPVVEALRGVGGVLEGERLTANSLSAVIRIDVNDGRSVLLAGDSDSIALRSMERRGVPLAARALVYPHHGGRSSRQRSAKAGRDFATRLTAAVSPSVVAFSFARDRFTNPRVEVVEGVRAAAPGGRIVCTQLSRHCAAQSSAASDHVQATPSSGKERMSCCAGTLSVAAGSDVLPSRDAHLAFIHKHVENAMCTSPDLAVSHGAAS